MDKPLCQSCAMPMDPEDYGRNADGSRNPEYCRYCFQKGKFAHDETLEEAIETNAGFMAKAPNLNLTLEEAREMMRQALPHLKRWQ